MLWRIFWCLWFVAGCREYRILSDFLDHWGFFSSVKFTDIFYLQFLDLHTHPHSDN